MLVYCLCFKIGITFTDYLTQNYIMSQMKLIIVALLSLVLFQGVKTEENEDDINTTGCRLSGLVGQEPGARLIGPGFESRELRDHGCALLRGLILGRNGRPMLPEIIEYVRIRNIDDPEDLSTCVDNSKNKNKDGKNKEKQTTHDNGSSKKQC
ncbi:hypothetical protein MS3_00003658 [Schistosoma haematobium]|uniref:Uncharacterized protein n=1 Tax=Schistosoma haematobium TaxID=6185 RepID=A0A6A5D8J4_SCHHA|nr:hypothetical protein MS3_00003658 [Schistosoma haematobium]KAH9594072.1 hypothetical protein MS3_00003658 [Schistosoma haematobium]